MKRSRREFFRQALGGVGIATLAGTVWSQLARQEAAAAPFALRPPGALRETDFLARCIPSCPEDSLSFTLRSRATARRQPAETRTRRAA